MQIELHTGVDAPVDTPLLVFLSSPESALPEAVLDAAARTAVETVRAAGDFAGRTRDETVLYPEGPAPRVALLGLGPDADVDAEALRRAAGRAVRVAESLHCTRLSLVLPASAAVQTAETARALAEGAVLASWVYREGQETDEDAFPVVTDLDLVAPATLDVAPDDLTEAVRLGSAAARGENLARTLQSRPGNVATPTHLAEEARAVAERTGLEVQVLGPEEMRSEGMDALLSVSQGSVEEPRFIVLRHRGGEKDGPLLALVGKGLTFDAGGISIKPSAGMEEMKFDMSGGAAVLGAMQAIAEAALPVDVLGVVPSSENLPSGSAVKPGDVIGSLAGKTIEVINTDAEGRLILADALAWTARQKPDAMVDCATLTGSCVIALGHHASGLAGSDEALVEEIRAAGERSGERCWPLPLWTEYRKQLDSEYADLKNVGGRPAGAITAAAFLKEFTAEVPWAHLDIAGTAYGDTPTPYQRKGARGVPTRLLFEWVRSRSA